MNNIYLISQDVNCGYDTFDSAVVIAESVEEARAMHPSDYVTHVKDGVWYETTTDGREYESHNSAWVKYKDIDKVKVLMIGQTDLEKQVVLASFNAG